MNATVNVLCYRSKTLANGEHPLMIRVSKLNQKKYKSLGISIKPQFWDFKRQQPKPNCPNKELILKIIREKELEFQKEILELNAIQREYTATSLLKSRNSKVLVKTVDEFYAEIIQKFQNNNHIGNARVYEHSYFSLKRFYNGKLDFLFTDIDMDFLKKYEQYLFRRGNKSTTISLNFRTLRSVYNKAIEAKYAPKNSYPFDEFKVSKFDVTTQKRAIPKEAIKKIMTTDTLKNQFYAQFSKDIFLFSYLCAGINFADIARLKPENIVDEQLSYIRQKTSKKISIPLSSETMEIIKKYSNNTNGYLFPILDTHIHKTEVQKYNRARKVRAKINHNLKKAAKTANINTSLTTYVARHSFATVLKNSGVNVALISEALGHSDIATTQIYLDSFDKEQVGEAMKNLL